MLHITGPEDGDPVKVGIPTTDLATGLFAHGAILAALLQRTKTGKGQKIDADLMSTQVASLVYIAGNYLNANQEGNRMGSGHETIVPYQIFKTKSGYLTLGTGSEVQFQNLCDRLNIPHIAKDSRFSTNLKRNLNRNELIPILSEILAKETSQHWMEVFSKVSFPVGPVNTMSDVFNDEHIKEIGLVKSLQHSTAGEVKVVGPPVVFSDSANEARTAAPTLGQHTDEVLKEVLNYDDEKIKDLRQQKIIQ